MKASLLFFSILILTLIARPALAQKSTKATDAAFARQPLWIVMMDDTLANFFVVERAFDTYFRYHQLPEGEHEVIGERRERLKRASKRKQRRIVQDNDMHMAVKRYRFWHEQTLPYVQANGRIMTPTERLSVWSTQQERR